MPRQAHAPKVATSMLSALQPTGVLLRFANAARDRQEWTKAGDLYSRYLRRQPNAGAIWVQLGHVAKEGGRLDSARDAYEQATIVAPDHLDGYIHLAHLLKDLGEYEGSLRAFGTALAIDPNGFDMDTQRMAGDMARELRDWQSAKVFYGAYLAHRSNDAAIWVQLGHAEKELRQLGLARASYERARLIAPLEADTHLQLGGLLAMLGDNVKAVEAYEIAQRLDFTLPGIELAIKDLRRKKAPEALSVDNEIRKAIGSLVDEDYYLQANPDVHAAGIGALAHYHLIGWQEGRDPSRDFNTSYYLGANPDVAAAKMDPLLHWIWAGRAEGRLPVRPLDGERTQLKAARDPRAKVPEWSGAIDYSAPLPFNILQGRLRLKPGVVVSIGHDDYTRNPGGVQNLIGDEQRACGEKGWDYLHLSPVAPIPLLADPLSDYAGKVVLRLNGIRLGVTTIRDLTQILKGQRDRGGKTIAVIHHFLGHAPEQITDLIRIACDEPPVVWLHDFFTLCPSYTLMRNDVSYCGAPPLASTSCLICCYGAARETHLLRIAAFFEAVCPRVLAPSQCALDIWLSATKLPHCGADILPLAELLLTSPRATRSQVDEFPIRIAHLGGRAFHKGWHVFEELALKLKHDSRYEFLQLGVAAGAPMPSCIQQVPVSVTPNFRGAMVEAIVEAGVDIVVAWSIWPETFCFTVHEALAAGAFVVANKKAGNIWPAVQLNAPEQGCAVDGREELISLFRDRKVSDWFGWPRRRGALIPREGIAAQLPTLTQLEFVGRRLAAAEHEFSA